MLLYFNKLRNKIRMLLIRSNGVTFLVLILSVFFSGSLVAQEIIKYKSSFPEEYYKTYLDVEEGIIEASTDTTKIGGYLKLARQVLRFSNELSLNYGESAFELSDKINDDSLRTESSMRIGLVHINLGNFDLSQSYIDGSIKYWTEVDDSMRLSSAHIYYGYLERARGNPYKGIEHLYKAKAIRLNYMTLGKLTNVTNRLIIAYSRIGDHEHVVKIGEEFLEAFYKTDTKKIRARTIRRNPA